MDLESRLAKEDRNEVRRFSSVCLCYRPSNVTFKSLRKVGETGLAYLRQTSCEQMSFGVIKGTEAAKDVMMSTRVVIQNKKPTRGEHVLTHVYLTTVCYSCIAPNACKTEGET